MRLTRAQFALIEHVLPVQRGNVRIDTVYTRKGRWAREGVLDRVFEELQMLQLLRVRIEVVSLDSTRIKVHPGGTGTLNAGAPKHRPQPRRTATTRQTSVQRLCDRGVHRRPTTLV